MPRTAKDWERRLQAIADESGKGPLHPVLLSLCADQLRQWEQVTEELATRPALVDEYHDGESGALADRRRPPEFDMQARCIQTIRSLFKDMGLVDLSHDPLKKIKQRLGLVTN